MKRALQDMGYETPKLEIVFRDVLGHEFLDVLEHFLGFLKAGIDKIVLETQVLFVKKIHEILQISREPYQVTESLTKANVFATPILLPRLHSDSRPKKTTLLIFSSTFPRLSGTGM